MSYQAAPLRAVAEQTGVASLATLAREPGTKAVYRITAHYPDQRAQNSVATLWHRVVDDLRLAVVYARLFNLKPLTYRVEREAFEAFTAALLKADFDRLHDQDRLRVYGEDVWMVERAAGTFVKSVLLAPHRSEPPYTGIVNAIDAYLPEAVREIS